mgnify:FL=1
MKMGVMLAMMFVIGFSDASYAQAPKYCDMDTRTGIRIQSSNNNGPIPFEIVDHHTLCFKPAMKQFEYIVTNGMCMMYVSGPDTYIISGRNFLHTAGCKTCKNLRRQFCLFERRNPTLVVGFCFEKIINHYKI